MRKSLITLLISSVFMLSACNEKDTQAFNEKLQQAEQTIAQLNQELAKSQQNLTAYKAESEQKLAEVEKVKEKLPALEVEIVPLFAKRETIKLKPSAAEYRQEFKINYFISTAKTGLEWLDNLLVRQLWLNYVPAAVNDSAKTQDPNQVTGKEKAELLTLLEKAYQENLAQNDGIGYSDTAETSYVGQRGNIATFSQAFYSYSGGAHGMYYTKYLVIDTHKKTLLTLDTLMAKDNQAKAKALLWDEYVRSSPVNEEGKNETFTDKADFYLADNFYFTEYGITFVYPPYALGAFAEGEKELTLPWFEANKLITTEYQRTKKDGFGLMPEDELR